MDWEFAFKAIGAINIVLTLGIAALMWLRKPGEDSGKAVERESAARTVQMAELSNRISRIEENLKHMPTNEELARLDGSLRESNARIESVQAMMARQGNQLDMIQRFLQESNRT